MRHSLFVNKKTTKNSAKTFWNTLYFIKFDLTIDYNRKRQKKKKPFKNTHPELDKSSMLDIRADPGQAEDNGYAFGLKWSAVCCKILKMAVSNNRRAGNLKINKGMYIWMVHHVDEVIHWSLFDQHMFFRGIPF